MLKAELTQPTVLTLYNPKANTKVSADASSFGLGAVLLQQSDEGWKPYASHSMTETERRYAQIEKEALATTWACEKFTDYILGWNFLIETDHKPLVPYSAPSTSIACLPMCFDFICEWRDTATLYSMYQESCCAQLTLSPGPDCRH